jgi:hypothetical protein
MCYPCRRMTLGNMRANGVRTLVYPISQSYGAYQRQGLDMELLKTQAAMGCGTAN